MILVVIDAGNRLELLPPSLSQLTKLEVLTLSSNHVYRLPEEMVGMDKLKVGARDRLFRSNSDTALTESKCTPRLDSRVNIKTVTIFTVSPPDM